MGSVGQVPRCPACRNVYGGQVATWSFNVGDLVLQNNHFKVNIMFFKNFSACEMKELCSRACFCFSFKSSKIQK
jgi:hypothetical protein